MATGFFGPTPEFDDFLGRYMTPSMIDSGFKRSGRQYVLRGPRGEAAVVHPRLYTPMPITTFFVEWAAVPAVLRDYIVSRHPKWRPSIKWGLVRARLTVPEELRGGSRYDSTSWQFISNSHPLPENLPRDHWMPEEEFGPIFRELLVTKAIPKWHRALTSDYLKVAYDTDEDLRFTLGGAMRGGAAWAEAILGAEEGDPVASAAAIDRMAERNPGDPIIPWLRKRLSVRTNQRAPSP